MITTEQSITYVYSGSFAPLHSGHLAIANYVETKYKTDVLFEICQSPIDKESVSDEDIVKRKQQFLRLGRGIALTDNSTFLQKAYNKQYYFSSDTRCPNMKHICFLVGMDTFERIDNPKYYYDSKAERDRCINLIKSKRCEFLVFPRGDKKYVPENESLRLISNYVDDDFTPVDISSTDIRNKQVSESIKSYELPLEYLGQFKIRDLGVNCCVVDLKGSRYRITNQETYFENTVCFNGEEYITLSKSTIVKLTNQNWWPHN